MTYEELLKLVRCRPTALWTGFQIDCRLGLGYCISFVPSDGKDVHKGSCQGYFAVVHGR